MSTDVQVSALGKGPVPVDIANTQTTSAEVDLEGFLLIGIWVPPNFNGTTITFLVAEKAQGTFQPLVEPNAGATVTVTVAAGKVTAIPPSAVPTNNPGFVRHLKLVAGSSQNANVRLFLIRKQGG